MKCNKQELKAVCEQLANAELEFTRVTHNIEAVITNIEKIIEKCDDEQIVSRILGGE